jgi:alcohol dehydrogenase class IV
MWFFRSPTIVHGEDALQHLREMQIRRTFIVTDGNIVKAGLLVPVLSELERAGASHTFFDAVEPEPALQTIALGAAALRDFDPDWIIALGGGSALDAAKAMWVLHENPGLDLESLSPMAPIVLRRKCRLIAIPTTAGTGSEATWAFVITLPGDATTGFAPRKLGSGHPLAVPDLAIVDPSMTRSAPPRVTADSGMDALTQAVEGYLATWANDYTDGLCLIATKLALAHLSRAYHDPNDLEAREKMANCAAVGGLGYINSMVGLAHSMGHAFGAIFHVPHGRAVGLFLPTVIEFYASDARPAEVRTRFVELARFVGLRHDTEHLAGHELAAHVRKLAKEIGQPLTIADLGIAFSDFEAKLGALVDAAMNDTVIFASPRQPAVEELRQLFVCAFEGRIADF